MWNERFSEPGFAYGTRANDFLVAVADRIPAGPVLSIAEGEGRNAVHLAELGHAVTAVDASTVGLEKTRRLAAKRGVAVSTVLSDLTDYQIARDSWAGIVSIFCHLRPQLRVGIHRACVDGLAPGGAFILEGFTPRQLAYGTGGPRQAELLMELADLEAELCGLRFEIAREVERPLGEGKYHRGVASVVQILAFKDPS